MTDPDKQTQNSTKSTLDPVPSASSPVSGSDGGETVATASEVPLTPENDVASEENPPNFDALELETEPDTTDQKPDATRDITPDPELLKELETASNKVKMLETELSQQKEQYMRIVADFENFRRRTQKEKEDLEQQIKCSTISEILPVLDNFERAKDHLKPQGEEAVNLHKSYQGIYKQFVDCLKRVGVAPMRAEGQPFDPAYHDAMLREPTDEYAEGTVMQELQRGYVLGDRVLRHAMVKVAAAPESMIPSDPDSPDDFDDLDDSDD
jgi:molecular chaperone GrpE